MYFPPQAQLQCDMLLRYSLDKDLKTQRVDYRDFQLKDVIRNCDVVTCHTVVYPTYHDQDRVATRPKMIAVNCHGSTSTVSRAILKLVYQFGISNSDPPTLKSVKINSSKNKQMTVQSHKSNVLSYSEYKITKIFWSFAPGTYWGGLTAPPVPDYPAAHWFFGSLCSSKNRHPQKIAGYATGPTGP